MNPEDLNDENMPRFIMLKKSNTSFADSIVWILRSKKLSKLVEQALVLLGHADRVAQAVERNPDYVFEQAVRLAAKASRLSVSDNDVRLVRLAVARSWAAVETARLRENAKALQEMLDSHGL